jgi:endonuclease G, mitochondrial
MAEKSDSGGFLFKTGLFALLAGIAYFFFNKGTPPQDGSRKDPTEVPVVKPIETPQNPQEPGGGTEGSTVPEDMLPLSTTGEIVRHRWFVLSYSEPHEQAEWVAYEIRRDRLNENWAERSNNFRPDFDVSTESATPRDYSGSGYDKGHLCAAADMAFNESAIDETFLMSNMSPQVRGFNGGIWRELEELSRDWARKFKKIYMVTGPVLTQKKLGEIGYTRVSVPAAYYKVLYAPDQHRAIAFMMPNAVSARPVMEYACNIDQVEAATGINFFPKLLNGLNEELEGSLDPSAWPIDRMRQDRRIREWNQR